MTNDTHRTPPTGPTPPESAVHTDLPEEDGPAPTAYRPPADRYGGAPGRGGRRALLIAGTAFVALGVGFAAWFATNLASDPVRAADVIGFDVVDSETITVTFSVTMTPGTTATCTLDALAPSYAQVGTREVVIGPVEESLTTYTVSIATSELATTGVLEGCTATSTSTGSPAGASTEMD
ncbi:DUF4307 domain-containing protein [Oerskovia flava]|uniref:DUF4307 domain-containing protein n=1 Tax=Oerskovia flava TaxID=2986422 RepID=UPI00223FC87C|nr:DUF4307 domain-containing protein [Oerskovia sp. JB1-3-2]